MKRIPDYPKYSASVDGKIYSHHKTQPRELRLSKNWKGYLCIGLRRDGKCKNIMVSRLVLLTHVGPAPTGHHAAHLNGIRDDNRLCNLAWVSASENEGHKKAHGTAAVGSRQGSSILNENDVRFIRKNAKASPSVKSNYKELGVKFGVSAKTVREIAKGRGWNHVK